tara:strand:- start:7182 stop:7499 length:318 start_codon:yes stop_codon:yes gene_type:complete
MNIVVENVPFVTKYDDNVSCCIYMSLLHVYNVIEYDHQNFNIEPYVPTYLDRLQKEWLNSLELKHLSMKVPEHAHIAYLKDELENHQNKELKADALFADKHNLPF